MQMLFQWDISEQDLAKLEAKFWRSAKAAENTKAFANRLFEGAAKEAPALDEVIVLHSENWQRKRFDGFFLLVMFVCARSALTDGSELVQRIIAGVTVVPDDLQRIAASNQVYLSRITKYCIAHNK